MTTIAANHCSFSDLIPFCATACCRPEAARENWEHVSVHRKRANGDYAQDSNGARKVYHYLMDKRTGKLYVPDSEAVVAAKCTGIFIGVPFYATVTSAYHVVALPVDIVRTAINAFKEFGTNCTEHGVTAAVIMLVKALTIDIILRCVYHIWGSVRAFLFAAAIMLVALYACINPYDARIAVGTLEYLWHDQISHLESFQHTTRHETADDDPCALFRAKVVYLAFCFQSVGSIHDKERIALIRPADHGSALQV